MAGVPKIPSFIANPIPPTQSALTKRHRHRENLEQLLRDLVTNRVEGPPQFPKLHEHTWNQMMEAAKMIVFMGKAKRTSFLGWEPGSQPPWKKIRTVEKEATKQSSTS